MPKENNPMICFHKYLSKTYSFDVFCFKHKFDLFLFAVPYILQVEPMALHCEPFINGRD